MAVQVQNLEHMTLHNLNEVIKRKGSTEVRFNNNRYYFYPDFNSELLQLQGNEPIWIYGRIRNKRRSEKSEKRVAIKLIILDAITTQSCEIIVHDD